MKELDTALCELVPLAIQCCLADVHQTDEKGWSKEACDQLCGLIEDKHLTAELLTSDIPVEYWTTGTAR